MKKMLVWLGVVCILGMFAEGGIAADKVLKMSTTTST